MYRIMYKTPNEDWECLGSYDNIEIAAAELERLKPLLLKEGCSLRLVPRGDEKYLD